MRTPRYLFSVWPQIRPQLARARHVALFTDFDGTLVRIVRQPGGARLSARVRRALTEISRAGAVVGVLSGRRLEDVRSRVFLRGIWYAGAHGFFLQDPANRKIARLAAADRHRIARVQRVLERRLRSVPGIVVEPKDATVAIHYRGASRRSRELAAAVLQRVLERDPSLHLMSGKKIWEVFPHAETDKWAAVRFILARERKHNPAAGRLLLYLGDDTTDERVFEKMSGISVVVGRKRHTAARYFLRSPAEVRQFLGVVKEALG